MRVQNLILKNSHANIIRYLVVNYERSNFSVSQVIWDESAATRILSIDATNASNATPPNVSKVQHTTSNSISTGTIIGIAVAVVALIIVAASGAFILIRRRRRKTEKGKRGNIDEVEPFQKPEMDATSKIPPRELYAEGKAGEVDSSSKIEMQGSNVDISTYDSNAAEMEGTRAGVEMEGTRGAAEMQGSRQEVEMEGSTLAGPVELYAGPYGLRELPLPGTAATKGSDLPSPSGGSRSNQGSGITSWTRRTKPTLSVPQSESSEISLDSAEPARRSGGTSMWEGRRPSDTASTQDVSSPTSESSRGHRKNRGDLLDQRLARAARSRAQPDISSPSDSSRERPRRPMDSTHSRNTGLSLPSDGSREHLNSGADMWNRRFGNSPRSLTPNDASSSSDRGRLGRERLGSAASGGSGGVSTPSQYHTPSRGSPQPPGNIF